MKTWLPVGLIGLVAIAAGLILPALLPAEAVTSRAEALSAVPSPGTLNYSPPSWPEAPNHSTMLLRLVLGTALVLGLCAGTLWVCKRWLRGTPAATAGNTQLRLLETLPLGNRCCVHLVHVANRPVLIGADASGIKTLVPLPEPFASTLLEAQGEEPVLGGATGFNRALT